MYSVPAYLITICVIIFQVKCHVEMSYFEVYNEKIHDLLVTREEPNQRRMPVSSLQSTETHFVNQEIMES